MKKSIKIVIILIVVFAILFVLGKFLLFNDSKLVCTKTYPDFQDKEIITIVFNWKGNAKKLIETQVMYFPSAEEALSFYESVGNAATENQTVLYYDSKMELDDNMIKSSFYFKISETHELYNKKIEEVELYYEKEYKYECEEAKK